MLAQVADRSATGFQQAAREDLDRRYILKQARLVQTVRRGACYAATLPELGLDGTPSAQAVLLLFRSQVTVKPANSAFFGRRSQALEKGL